MPLVHLFVAIVVVLGIVGLCWYLLKTSEFDARIKTIFNVLIVIGLVAWLLLWLLPRLLALT